MIIFSGHIHQQQYSKYKKSSGTSVVPMCSRADITRGSDVLNDPGRNIMMPPVNSIRDRNEVND